MSPSNMSLAKVLEKNGEEGTEIEMNGGEKQSITDTMIPTAFMPCNPLEHPHDINLNARTGAVHQ